MHKRLFTLLLATAALATPGASPSAWAARCIIDDGGDRICLEAPARRIVPLYAAFTDILTDMHLEDRIAGRTKADDGPESATPSIGTHMRPNMELVLGLRPDLALQMGGRAEAAQSVAALRNHGVPTAFFQVRTFADLFSVIERIGTLTGAEDGAEELVRSLQRRLDALGDTLKNAPRPRPGVFFEVRYPNLLGAGPDSLVTDIIRAAGGVNVLAGEDASSGTGGAGGTGRTGRIVRLSEEELLRLNPDVYCVQTGPMNKNPAPLADRPHFAVLRAVALGRVLVVDEHVFSRPGPKAVDAAELLAAFLHPGLFPPAQEAVKP
ncbi:ABC-type transporter, periplasmic subunit [uncultured delta proteobacterium]|uniref:ABC-type transporter, periplasmic subunit n=1 Tax=uncultured delta proteobacterium TaxID=34034 RepID=A0A212JHD2_9DELT|nr:ABC-type transporter, periplasmic subunit [uncultured delta proteobacterium]